MLVCRNISPEARERFTLSSCLGVEYEVVEKASQGLRYKKFDLGGGSIAMDAVVFHGFQLDLLNGLSGIEVNALCRNQHCESNHGNTVLPSLGSPDLPCCSSIPLPTHPASVFPIVSPHVSWLPVR